ncbi:MAG: hypothetical protein JWM25_1738 [Thermoleophilia bacterium]|nr:hypothetical protein [Thermoleophilia bacterium]MCZ4497153.1 hypothetical protein [Thermoleophilia bacterium]
MTRLTKRGSVRRAIAVLLCVAACAAVPSVALAHGGDDADFRTIIEDIEPAGIPIDVRSADGDQLRIENKGDAELVVCGYVAGCEPYVRIGPLGVFENRNSKAYFANLDEVKFGEIPEGAGTGAPEWKRVRRAPAFFAYHDHRAHWMGGRLPPNIDDGNPDTQKVNDFKVTMRYGDTDVLVTGRLEYIGGSTWIGRYGEYVLMVGGVLVMLVVFLVDVRRRRAARGAAAPTVAAGSADA